MGAPPIETVRPGVQFEPGAAASFRRAEAGWGRKIRCNSTYRDYGLQLSMYQAWTAWTEGWGPKPNHSRALHPDKSVHCQGRALDTPDWTVAGFIAHMADHGWIRTAASDPTEQHHFEYQWWKDQHRNDPAPTGTDAKPFKEDDMPYTPKELKQIGKDALFEFMRDVNTPPPGAQRWAFVDLIASQVWTALVDAQDGAGNSIRDNDGNPIRYQAGGFLASTNGRVGGSPAEVDEAELAASLAPLLAARITALSDDDVARLAKAAADETDRRERERLAS